MRRFLTTRSLSFLCVIVTLATMLTALAVLEYHWATKVSEASREQMQANLRSALRDVGAGFDRELLAKNLRHDVFLKLIRGRFSTGELADYYVGVVGGSPAGELLYGSEPWLSSRDFASPDEELPLLDSNRWILVAKHRSGSLSAAVESIRLRCLAINFGVLLVLGLAVAMVVVSALRAQTSLKLQMEFVASVSHGLRTPLSVIGSAADNLAEGVVRSDQSVREYGSLIRGECRRLSRLVEQTLQFAAGKADFRPRNVEFLRVEDVVSQVLADASAIIDASSFIVEKNIDLDLPKIRVNMETFSECLLNLISNALKYASQSPWIGIRAHSIETGRGTGVRITIEDRGPGIPEEELPHIFEPFYRGRDARAAQIRGTGLGLSLAQEAAMTMGARITVESVVGMGSAFTIHMPASYMNSSTVPVEAMVES
jgi:signal transduction histidine kinase